MLHPEKSIFQEISDSYPTLTETQIRNMLAAFLFTGDEVFKLISSLSGGERGRVSLAKLMLSEANFLILDEPTNHLDIASKEILEEALNSYTGTVFYVSHDRYFINQTATRILDLTNQAVVNYIGNYDYYLEKKDELTEKYAPASQQTDQEEEISQTKLSWQQRKEEQARQRKAENQLKKTEQRIEELETRDQELDAALALPEICTDVAKMSGAEPGERRHRPRTGDPLPGVGGAGPIDLGTSRDLENPWNPVSQHQSRCKGRTDWPKSA